MTGFDVWFTAKELADLHHVAVGTIYRWASEDQWPRRNRARPVLYSAFAAEQSATRRRQNSGRL